MAEFFNQLIGWLSCIGWIMGLVGVVALLANRDARRERERNEKAAAEKTSSDQDGK